MIGTGRNVGEIDSRSMSFGAGLPALTQREPGDDFICLRYRVWYPSLDCAIRTRYRTCPGCSGCEQGLFNLKRHGAALQRMRFVPPDRD